MATQEIDLNEALAAEGIAAWETDLAELIVQLGDDLPSHILVPAIHRNRAEIREIFRTRMASAGRPAPEDLTDEPRELAAAARLHLREKFLRAKVAVSGANFAVAETGTLVVVESEGNGRMCLTLPEVLVTVVGIEKVVPTWQDLDVFLQLLPRSSTGERMNPYTSTWSGVTPGDGPQEVHVVLLDNGRTNVAGRRGRPAGAALHPLLGLPERLPGLRAHRRARLRLGLPRADRRDPQPAAQGRRRRRADRLAALRLRRCAAPASRSARCASTSRRCWSTCAARWSTRTGPDRSQGQDARDEGRGVGARRRAPSALAELASGLSGRVGRRSADARCPVAARRSAGCRGRRSLWTDARDLPSPPRESFRAWWRRTDGGRRDDAGRAGERPRRDPGPRTAALGDAERRAGEPASLARPRRPAAATPTSSTCSPSGSRTTARRSSGARADEVAAAVAAALSGAAQRRRAGRLPSDWLAAGEPAGRRWTTRS